ncbi:hypothetical protein vBKpnPMUC100_046 [Klebsiella phage vB_KpnP_MUC100]|uniref:Uncharacterized protein n=1 Tax=Klebsiella phage vB_KpnP_MUC100 TaxID=3065244 RepID=A0AAX4G491_9CAUD|nr:hypothetical protein vBKpnPMUC100_046 [Klebsiella phage vB_KpnP_MUC100]
MHISQFKLLVIPPVPSSSPKVTIGHPLTFG